MQGSGELGPVRIILKVDLNTLFFHAWLLLHHLQIES